MWGAAEGQGVDGHRASAALVHRGGCAFTAHSTSRQLPNRKHNAGRFQKPGVCAHRSASLVAEM